MAYGKNISICKLLRWCQKVLTNEQKQQKRLAKILYYQIYIT